MNIGGVEIGPDQPCRVVAEISNNHNGSLDLAKRLIRECADAGADLIKFQAYTPDELVSLRGDGLAPDPWGADGWTMRDLYKKAQTPHAWFPELVAECEAVGVPWFSSAFGYESLDLLLELGCPAYKFAALDVHHHFAQHAADTVNRLGAATIASSRGERIYWADLTLFCPEGYPQDWPEVLVPIAAGAQTVDHLDGVSYHGTDVGWAKDLARGAMLEVHVQLDDEPSELEPNVSLTVSQLAEVCAAVHRGALL